MTSPKTKGRMINKDISDSKGFAALSSEAAVLFAMMIPHYSPYGKMNGDPGYLKGEVCPRVPYITVRNIPNYLKEITEHTSVKWFEYDGRYWIHSLNFLCEHQKINTEKLGKDLLPNYSRVTTELLIPEGECECEGEGEGKGASSAPVSDEEYVQQVKIQFNAMMDDPAQTAEWREWYAKTMSVDDVLFAACTWLVDRPHQRKSRLRQFYGNWLRREFQDRTKKREAANV